MLSSTILGSFFILVLIAITVRSSVSRRRAPGPWGLPLVGNILQVPKQKTWLYFERLSRQYGSIVRLNLAGNELLVLNNAQDAEELLGQRSRKYSSRPPLIYAGKYQSKNKRLVLLPYGKTLKRQRAAFARMVQPKVVDGYEVIQEMEASKLLYEMLTRPRTSTRHLRRFAASLVFHLSYGDRLKDDDNDLEAVTAVLSGFVQDTYPGSHLVDSFPSLDYLPALLAPWRKEATEKHHTEMKLYQRLALDVKTRIEQGDNNLECFAARLWDDAGVNQVDLEELSYLAGSAFEAGTDTSTGTMQWFIMAMVLFPSAMRAAQDELDAVLGADGCTMPGFEHFGRLPYCSALVKEVFRWAPSAPGGFPHLSDEDDWYKGFFIPGGTMVIPCIWSMHHDENEFPNPYSFLPERFLSGKSVAVEYSDLLDGHYSFGFGRRKCPGQHLGAKSMWIGMIRLLWAFNIAPQHDEEGHDIPVDPTNCTSGMTSRPVDFPFKMTVRSNNHERTILEGNPST